MHHRWPHRPRTEDHLPDLIDPRQLEDPDDGAWLREQKRKQESYEELRRVFLEPGWRLLDQMLEAKERGEIETLLTPGADGSGVRKVVLFIRWLRALPDMTAAEAEHVAEEISALDEEVEVG